jgi:hypothetical protein
VTLLHVSNCALSVLLSGVLLLGGGGGVSVPVAPRVGGYEFYSRVEAATPATLIWSTETSNKEMAYFVNN